MLKPSPLCFKGFALVEHRDKTGKLIGIYRVPNGVVDVGADHALECEFSAGAQVTTWYIGLVNNSGYTAWDESDTMASHAGWAEFVDYSEGTRPQWTCGTAASRQITNAATVDFSVTGAGTLKGIFVASNNTKSGATGTLWSVALFSSNVTVGNGDTLKVTYTITIP
jgi:hypothetical protein